MAIGLLLDEESLPCISKYLDDKGLLVEEILKIYEMSNKLENHDEFGVYQPGHIFSLAVGSLLKFIQINWVGPEDQDLVDALQKISDSAIILHHLSVGGERPYSLCRCPFLLYFSLECFKHLHQANKDNFVFAIWYMRSLFVQQKLLDHPVGALKDLIEKLIADASNLVGDKSDNEKLIFYIEKALVASFYDAESIFEKHLESALSAANLNFSLTGKLGKRTKFQENEIAQLVLDVCKLSDSREAAHVHKRPENLPLNDDTLLEEINLNESKKSNLAVTDQCILLAYAFNYLQNHPKDTISLEKVEPFANKLLEYPGNWLVYSMSLLLRSKVEYGKSRKMERATLQVQELVNQLELPEPLAMERLMYVFQVSCPTRWDLEKICAGMFRGLGGVKTALAIYEKLEMWDEAVACYIQLGLKKRAEEIVRDRLENDPSNPKLLCILGDLKQDKSYYEQAWEVSGQRYSRAQISLAHYFFNIKKLPECIQSLSLAVALNPLFEKEWFLKGICEMCTNLLNEALFSFGRVVSLDHEHGEAWNNIGEDALRCFKEAARNQYNSSKIWENILTTALYVGNIQDSLHAIEEIYRITSSFDIQVLQLLADICIKSENSFGKLKFDQDITRLKSVLVAISSQKNTIEILELQTKIELQLKNFAEALDVMKKTYRLLQSTSFSSSEFYFIKFAEFLIRFCEASENIHELDSSFKVNLLVENFLKKTNESFSMHPKYLELLRMSLKK